MIQYIRLSAYRTTNHITHKANNKLYNIWRCLSHCLSRTVHPESNLSAVSRLYISDCLARLIYHWKLIFERLDIGWSIIIYQNALFYYWDCTSGKLYISLSRITHIKTFCTIIGIIHPEVCISAHQGLDKLSCFFKNILSLIWASSWLMFFILMMLKGTMQEGCTADTTKATGKFLSLSQNWFKIISCI